MSLVVEMKPQLWQTPLSVSVCTLRCRSQLALVVKADRQMRHTKGRSPLWLRMWISRELALGQLLRHWGKGQMRSLGYGSLGFSSMAAVVGELALWRLAQ